MIGLRLKPTIFAVAVVAMGISTPAAAQNRETPYWASIRVSKINMRVGPSESYRIEWVYERPSLPLKVLRIKEGWRLVVDADGAKGWVVARFLTRDRTAIVVGEGVAPMRAEPEHASRLLWNVEPGVVGKLGDCETGWCRFDVTGRMGWVPEQRLWGPGKP